MSRIEAPMESMSDESQLSASYTACSHSVGTRRRAKEELGAMFRHLPLHSLETGSLAGNGTRLAGSKPQGRSCLHLPQH